MDKLILVVPDINDDQPVRLTKISEDENENPQIGAKNKIPNIPVYTRCLNCDINFPTKYLFQRHHCEFIETETELKENDNPDLQNKKRRSNVCATSQSKHEDKGEEAPKNRSEVFGSPKELVCSGKKRHICLFEGCSAQFTLKAGLNDHRRKVHTRERPFICKICDKRFLTGSVYYQHCLIHKNDRRYECEICGKKFFRSDAVKKHRRIHSGEKPHTCETCQKCFRQKCDLTRHIKSRHVNI